MSGWCIRILVHYEFCNCSISEYQSKQEYSIADCMHLTLTALLESITVYQLNFAIL